MMSSTNRRRMRSETDTARLIQNAFFHPRFQAVGV
jgi:hypothetical protein